MSSRNSPNPLRLALSWLLWRTGIAELSRSLLTRHGRFALMFHGISARKHPSLPLGLQPYLSASDLRAVLTWLRSRFDFLTPDAFLQGSASGLLLTFDDGFANNYTLALPVLEDFHAPAVFFVATQHVKSPQDWLPFVRQAYRHHFPDQNSLGPSPAQEYFNGMSTAQLADCARHPLVTIGSHTVTHPLLTTCTNECLQFELLESKHYLEIITGKNIELFAYPAGDYNLKIIQAVKAAGYHAAFVEDSMAYGDPIYEIPRIGLYDSSPLYLAMKLSGLYRPALRSNPSLGEITN